MPCRQNAGNPQDVSAGRLNWPVADRALVELENSSAAGPAEGCAHAARLQRVLHPIIRPAPILREQFAVLVSISCASKVETPSRPARVSAAMPYCVASSMTLYFPSLPRATSWWPSSAPHPPAWRRRGKDLPKYISSMVLTGPQCLSDSTAAIMNSMDE